MSKTSPFAPVKAKIVTFTFQALATALVKAARLHEGIWRVGFRFELRAANINIGGHQVPAAFLPIVEVSLTKVEKADDLSVDAAAVNPEARIITPTSMVN